MPDNLQILFLSHGGGPLPLLGDSGHQAMVDCLKNIAATLIKPDAILMISAHWEESQPTITAHASPSLIYDYYGFPDEAYRIQYPCPGEPALAQQVHRALEQAGMHATLDTQRGLDHGVFVPLKIMYPEADIPCVELSLVNSLDAQTHVQIGQALRNIDYANLLVIGSGFTFHNMRAFFGANAQQVDAQNHTFERWLLETCTSQQLSEAAREKRLINWAQAPYARYCQPREEHLLPLHVCYGLAQSASDNSFEVNVINKKVSFYSWAPS